MRRLGWHRYEDAIRTQIQETGRVRLTFLRLLLRVGAQLQRRLAS